MGLVQAINEHQTDLFSVGCVSGSVEDENGFRDSGYVEISINSASAIVDARCYFSLFFHFDCLLHESAFSGKVAYNWELQPVTFVDANVSGFTCSIFVNTHYSRSKADAEAARAEALGVLGHFLGCIPRAHNDLIYGR